MHRRQAIFFPLILAAMLALLTFWINQTVEKNGPKTDGSNRHDHDYMLNNFYTTKTDLAGNLHYVLAATQMEHFPDDDSTVLQRPRFTQYTINKPYTQITGLRGYVSSDGEEVQIVDNVKVVRQASEGKGEMQILTEKLTIYPKQEIAKTDSPVIIKQFPKTEIHATGMILNKKEQTLILGVIENKPSTAPRARVHVHYERPVAAEKVSQKSVPNKAKIRTKPIANEATQKEMPNTKKQSKAHNASKKLSSTLSKTLKPSANNSEQTKRVRRTYE